MNRTIQEVNVTPQLHTVLKTAETVIRQLNDKITAFTNAAVNNQGLVDELNDLEKEADQKFREHDIDLNLRIKENEQNVLSSLAEKFFFALVPVKEMEEMDARISKELADKEKEVSAKFGAQVSTLKSAHQQVEVELRSELRFKDSTIENLNNQIAKLQEQYDRLRETHESTVKALAGKSDTFNIGK